MAEKEAGPSAKQIRVRIKDARKVLAAAAAMVGTGKRTVTPKLRIRFK